MVRRRSACETTPARPMATLKMFALTYDGNRKSAIFSGVIT